jgi:hypothetical protein
MKHYEKQSKVMTIANRLVKIGYGRSTAMIKAWRFVKSGETVPRFLSGYIAPLMDAGKTVIVTEKAITGLFSPIATKGFKIRLAA